MFSERFGLEEGTSHSLVILGVLSLGVTLAPCSGEAQNTRGFVSIDGTAYEDAPRLVCDLFKEQW